MSEPGVRGEYQVALGVIAGFLIGIWGLLICLVGQVRTIQEEIVKPAIVIEKGDQEP